MRPTYDELVEALAESLSLMDDPSERFGTETGRKRANAITDLLDRAQGPDVTPTSLEDVKLATQRLRDAAENFTLGTGASSEESNLQLAAFEYTLRSLEGAPQPRGEREMRGYQIALNHLRRTIGQ